MNAKFAISGAAVVFALAAMGTIPAYAIDLVEAAPKQTKVLVDNDKVRVLEVTIKKGDKIPMHSHPDMVVYTTKGGRVKWTLPDGKTMETTSKAGEVMFRPAISHAHEHFDDAHAIVVELKK